MPTYDFINVRTGERVEKIMTMAEAPAAGDIIDIDGEKLRKLPTAFAGVKVQNYAHVSMTLPRDCKHAPRHDEKGRCVFKNEKEIRDTMSRCNDDPTMPSGYAWEKG